MGIIPIPSVVLNVCIALFTLFGWLQVLLRGDADSHRLAQRGVGSLRYYTVLSNLFSGVAAVAYLLVGLTTSNGIPTWLLSLKLASAAAVTLTLLTVLVLLGPRLGWKPMFSGGNFWLHLVLPLAAILDCCAFVPVSTLPFSATLLALAPTIAYGVWYIGTVLVLGTEKDGVVHDIYGFFQWGIQKLPLVVMALLGANWSAAVCMWLVNRLFV